MTNPNLSKGSQHPRRYTSNAYYSSILALVPFVYWPMNETAGTSIVDLTGNGHTAKATGITWTAGAGNEGQYAAYFDGINDSGLGLVDASDTDNGVIAAWNRLEGTAMAWCQVDNASVWTDGTIKAEMRIGTSTADNGRSIVQKGTTNNQFRLFNSNLGGGSTRSSFSPTTFFPVAWSWSNTNNRMRIWIGADDTMTEVAYASPDQYGDINRLDIGNSSGTNYWFGYISDIALWDSELSQATIEGTLLVR